MNRPLKNLLTFTIAIISLITLQLSFASAPYDPSLAPMLQKVLPAIVNIKAQIKVTDFNTLSEIQRRQREKSGNPNEQPQDVFLSVASGVIINSNEGYIITNAHVINDAQKVVVTLSDGRHFNAKIIGMDKPSDIALLQIKAKNLTAVSISDSNRIKVGDYVAAIGNPFGLNQTVTSGIVSALGRSTLGIENYENFIQTDAPINPGNSGGALINMQGQLVGINTAILAPDRGSIGIGFAIPANMAKSIMNQLVEYGDVKRGLLGVGTQDVTPDLTSAFNTTVTQGAAVTQILPNSPAEQAGIKVGDIITTVNGSSIKNASDVINTIGFLRVDSRINVELQRKNEKISVNVNLTDPKKREEIIQQKDPFLYGVALKDFSLLSPIHGNIEGILVVSVQENSNAWQSDLRAGDVITSINQEPVKNIAALKAVTAKSNKVLLLNVLRGTSAIFLVLDKPS